MMMTGRKAGVIKRHGRPLLAELCDLIARHVVESGALLAALPNIVLGLETGATLPCIHVAEPVFSLIAQGTKQIEVGDRTLTYGPGEGMAVSIELPMNTFVIDASRDAPFLGVGLRIRPEAVAALLLEQPAGGLPPDPAGIVVGTMPEALIEAVIRLLRLLDHPGDLAVLGPAMGGKFSGACSARLRGRCCARSGWRTAIRRGSGRRCSGCATIWPSRCG
jgi:hypothetical protein